MAHGNIVQKPAKCQENASNPVTDWSRVTEQNRNENDKANVQRLIMWPWIDSRNRFRNDVVTGGSRFYLGMCMKILLKMQKIHGTHTVYYD